MNRTSPEPSLSRGGVCGAFSLLVLLSAHICHVCCPHFVEEEPEPSKR